MRRPGAVPIRSTSRELSQEVTAIGPAMPAKIAAISSGRRNTSKTICWIELM